MAYHSLHTTITEPASGQPEYGTGQPLYRSSYGCMAGNGHHNYPLIFSASPNGRAVDIEQVSGKLRGCGFCEVGAKPRRSGTVWFIPPVVPDPMFPDYFFKVYRVGDDHELSVLGVGKGARFARDVTAYRMERFGEVPPTHESAPMEPTDI